MALPTSVRGIVPLKENEDAPISSIEKGYRKQLADHISELRTLRKLHESELETYRAGAKRIQSQLEQLDKRIKMLEHLDWLCLL